MAPLASSVSDFIQMLEHHPWFEVAWLAASDRSEGKVYCRGGALATEYADPGGASRKMKVSPATPDGAPKIIFAALDAGIAAEMEPQFADAGCAVVSAIPAHFACRKMCRW